MINSSQSKTSAILTSFSTLFFFTSNSSSARQSRVCFSNKMFTNQLMWVHSHSLGAEKEQGSLIFRKLIIAKIRPHFHLPFTFTSVRGVVTKLRSHARAVSARALAITRDKMFILVSRFSSVRFSSAVSSAISFYLWCLSNTSYH